MSTKQESFEKAFYSDGYNLGMKAVEGRLTKESLYSSIEELYLAIDSLTDSLETFANQQGTPVNCRNGCEWCCHQPIFALSYEMEYLNNFIKSYFDEDLQKEIKNRADSKNNKLKILNTKELLNSKFPCPLLQNGSCIAYDARPMACRIYLSTSVSSCLDFYKKPEDENNIPALLDFPMRAGRKMNEGFKAAIKTGGLNTVEFRIEEILLVPPVKLSTSVS